MSVRLFNSTLDGKPIAWSSETVFLVQVGKGRKGKYHTRYSFKGDLARACMFYRSLNIGNGYKKRLYAEGFNKPVLARYQS